MFFSPNKLTLALAGLTAITSAHAAGLDRSGQDVTAFLQDGTYAEVSYTYIDGDVTGHDNANLGVTDLNAYTKGNKIDDIAEAYDFMRYGVKADINDTVSVGILYDEPWGAGVKYEGNNNFVSDARLLMRYKWCVRGIAEFATAQAAATDTGAQQACGSTASGAAGNTAQAQARLRPKLLLKHSRLALAVLKFGYHRWRVDQVDVHSKISQGSLA